MHILYHPTGAVTARAIAAGLGARLTTTPPERAVDVLVRWGSAKRYPHRALVLNGNGAVLRAGNKLGAMETFRQCGVITPPTYNTLPMNADAYPLLERDVRHSQARDIKLVMQPRDATRNHPGFYVGYIPTDREYRIHVFNGEIIRAQRKEMADPEQTVPWIRNHTHGYVFKGVRPESCVAECGAAKRAVEALGMLFGAVDVIRGVDGQCWVLEVNTAPAASYRTALAYCNAIRSYAQAQTGREFRDYTAELAAHYDNQED